MSYDNEWYYINDISVVKGGYIRGDITKDLYKKTLRAYQTRHNKMKSDNTMD